MMWAGSKGVAMFDDSDDENEAAGAPAQRRAAGRTRRAEEQVPEFGAGQLIGEIDCQRPARCPPPQPARPVLSHMRVLSLTWALFLSRPAAEKFYGEIDRQIRSSNGVRNVVRRHGPGGSVSHEAGADILSQAAIGESLLGYTEAVSGRNSIRTGTCRVKEDSLTHRWHAAASGLKLLRCSAPFCSWHAFL